MKAFGVSAGSELTLEQEGRDKILANLKLLGRRILGLKCFNDHIRNDDDSVLLYMTDENVDTTSWFQVLQIGPECQYLSPDILETHDVFLHFPIWDDGMHGLGCGLFVVDEAMMDRKDPKLIPVAVFTEK